ncbi:MAG: type VI secretion system baseplate subunit TssK [Betaproteobacteria bacterium HGW-Betaproteobacteria-13]|jgi:type VI secretion system protein ImpJ|uniref:Type VI secretion system-associated protein n=1 Tax=Parazoarcus communis TaxID=41977 RepID=A0A2U8H8H5_9RHOO|nr:type VI secretion system baseplate subunit TssK [Parazoarcus communis]AWI81035.1 type VI secretion system-associated protein [Parazoarcus communis]PKO81435.1 MAG: type VI secretion system baseplate subunit TssK [Betaproteobacteria bacterium HGW-Betaproteobacteria-13]
MDTSKVLWGEGLFLRPQHFQQQDAYLESLSRNALLCAQPYGWGIRKLEVDLDALSSGILRLNCADVVFEDGETYRAPQIDRLPEPVMLDRARFSDGATEFHLGIRHLQRHGSNCAAEDAQTTETRFIITPISLSDRCTDAVEAEVSVLRKRGVLKSALETLDSYQNLPALRVRKTPGGAYECDPEFMPPMTCICASPRLLSRLQALLDSLEAKSHALHGLHREPSRSVIEFRSGDHASFWLQHTVSSAYAALSHLRHAPMLHPERLFQELLRLGGSLMTFSRQHQLSDLPAYDHAHPGQSFVRIDEILRSLLETVISARYFSIALHESKPAFHTGRLDSGKITPDSLFYLAVRANQPLSELIESVPLRMKIGAPDDVEKLVLSALSGVQLTHTPQVPSAIPVRPGTCYFALDSKGALYQRMLKAQAITIYAPSNYQDLSLELIALSS